LPGWQSIAWLKGLETDISTAGLEFQDAFFLVQVLHP
jgi:hypothetical protein